MTFKNTSYNFKGEEVNVSSINNGNEYSREKKPGEFLGSLVCSIGLAVGFGTSATQS